MTMAKNFDYILKSTGHVPGIEKLYNFCDKAECFQKTAPEESALNSRRALEWIVRAIYAVKGVEAVEGCSLFELVDNERFKEFVGNEKLMMGVHYVRRVGNAAAHLGSVSKREAFFSLLNVYNFVGAALVKLGVVEDFPDFDNALVPDKKEVCSAAEEKPLPSAEFVGSVDASRVRLTAMSGHSMDISEEETRRLFVDLMLREAGWEIPEKKGAIRASAACVEVEIEGMPNGEGKGYADYVLFGNDGLPLAVVEAKRTSRSPMEGEHQAVLYADCLEKRYKVRPVIYLTNGFSTYIIDGLGYPKRRLYAFHSEADLHLLIGRRGRGDIVNFKVKDSITDRAYQKTAVKRVCEHFNKKHRRALLVMATGTGKTRVAISLADVLMRNEWVKNVLFLADRTSLVRQAHKNFVKLLPDTTTCVLSERNCSNLNLNARIMFSTYQTMINCIDTEVKNFSVGRFDLIIIDEAHRSVFGKFGAIFNYFDSLLVGLTATPREDIDKSTYDLLGLEDGMPNFEYSLAEAVKDGYLVPYSAFKKGTLILQEGIKYDSLSREEQKQLEAVFESECLQNALKGEKRQSRDIGSNEIFTYIFNVDTIDRVLQDLMQNGQRVQGGERIGKTVIFAYNHEHAELIVKRFGDLFPEYGADFCVLIDNYVKYAQDLIDRMEERDRNPQIAVSVDMLDTGIDIPDLLNLVFFKIVRSKIKFQQMIGRGTRLSKDIFGKGKDKECFYIFDWCRNFEFFGKNPDGVQPVQPKSLTERLFCVRIDLAFELQKAEHQSNPFEKQLHDELKATLMAQVKQLNDKHISVRAEWENAYMFRQKENWQCLSQLNVELLKRNIAPLLIKGQDDESAKRFDLLMLNIELSKIDATKQCTHFIKNVVSIAQTLSTKAAIPQVMEKMEYVNMVLSEDFWEKASLNELERVRCELRDLVKFIFAEKRQSFEVDIEDTVIDNGLEEEQIRYTTYYQRVFDYLVNNRNLPVLQKIVNLEQLTNDDIKELERILWNELGSKDEYRHCTETMICGDCVAVFIRSIIGIDRSVALKKFSQFIDTNELSSRQEEYLKSILDYVCANGDIENSIIINKPPFNNIDLWDLWGDDAQSFGRYVNLFHTIITAKVA